jgi:5-methylcytosine-specific restriction endonuclease McrA
MVPLSPSGALAPASLAAPDVVSAAAAELASRITAQLDASAAVPVAPQAIMQAVSQALTQAVARIDSSTEEGGALRAKMTPLSPGRYCWQLTMSQRGQDMMDEARDLAGGDPRANDPVEILIEALAMWVEKRRKEKFAEAAHPRAQRGEAKGRHIPAAIRRIVAARDGRQCTFVSADGTRCDERRDLQFDHIPPLACGGETTAKNLRLLCREHNQHVARLAFGAAHVNERTKARQRAALRLKAQARGNVPGADTPGTAQECPRRPRA